MRSSGMASKCRTRFSARVAVSKEMEPKMQPVSVEETLTETDTRWVAPGARVKGAGRSTSLRSPWVYSSKVQLSSVSALALVEAMSSSMS